MPATTPHALPYPSGADAPDVPVALQTLAEAVDLNLPVLRRKPVALSRSNTIVAAIDADFSLSLPVGFYRVTAILHCSGPAAADVRARWNFTGAASGFRSVIAPDLATTSVLANQARMLSYTLLATDAVYGTDGTNVGVAIEELSIGVTVTGTLEFWWAQQVANATPSVMQAGSRIICQRVALV